ncbi:MAG: alanyl-tRNA editing protein [Planctomycetota bacterium]
MTEKLYYTQPDTTSFTAKVLECTDSGEGRFTAILDQTAFYPESGGQPYDLGTLGGRNVLEVREEDSRIHHLLDGALTAGSEVDGNVDADRRMDNSIHHTAQHVITGLFLKHGDYRTMSFHISSDTARIDLTGEISRELLEEVEAEVGRVIRERRKVTLSEITRAEYDATDLRKKKLPDGVDSVRLIEIEGVDFAHCGGTHVSNTAEIGFVLLVKTERVRGLTRLHYVAGERARRYISELRTTADEAAVALSVGWRDLPRRAKEILDELKKIRKHRHTAEREVVDRMVQEFSVSNEPFVEIRTDDLDPSHLVVLARRLGEQGKIAVVSSRVGLVAIATPEEQSPDAGNVVSMIKKEFPVKGGGRGNFAQLAEVSDDMMPHIRQRIIEMFREGGE